MGVVNAYVHLMLNYKKKKTTKKTRTKKTVNKEQKKFKLSCVN